VLGTGVERSTDPESVRRFAQRASVPVATTMGSLGSFPHEHPLFLGAVGAAGHPSAHAYLNDEADLVVAVGTGLDVMTRRSLDRALARCKLAVVNVDPGQVCRSTTPALVVQADAGRAFRAMLQMLEREPFHHGAPEHYVLTRYRSDLAPPPPDSPPAPAGALLQSEAISLLQAYLPAEGHMLFDAGNCAVAAIHGLEPPRGVSTTIALGMGGMGYAVAGAIGAQLGAVRGRTIVLCGDGAFLMQGFELHTAIEQRLPILFVVFNNGGHGMCVTRQQLMFDGRLECTRYTPVDIASLARSLGGEDALWTGSAATMDSLRACLDEFTERHQEGPGVLEVVLQREEIPPFGPFLGAAPRVTPVVRSASQRPAA
jgi:acetolactate synthase-1/2/3 large subunit